MTPSQKLLAVYDLKNELLSTNKAKTMDQNGNISMRFNSSTCIFSNDAIKFTLNKSESHGDEEWEIHDTIDIWNATFTQKSIYIERSTGTKYSQGYSSTSEVSKINITEDSAEGVTLSEAGRAQATEKNMNDHTINVIINELLKILDSEIDLKNKLDRRQDELKKPVVCVPSAPPAQLMSKQNQPKFEEKKESASVARPIAQLENKDELLPPPYEEDAPGRKQSAQNVISNLEKVLSNLPTSTDSNAVRMGKKMYSPQVAELYKAILCNLNAYLEDDDAAKELIKNLKPLASVIKEDQQVVAACRSILEWGVSPQQKTLLAIKELINTNSNLAYPAELESYGTKLELDNGQKKSLPSSLARMYRYIVNNESQYTDVDKATEVLSEVKRRAKEERQHPESLIYTASQTVFFRALKKINLDAPQLDAGALELNANNTDSAVSLHT